MKQLKLTIIVLIVSLITFFSWGFVFVEKPLLTIKEQKIEQTIFITKPFPLNTWDYVENTGGYFLEVEKETTIAMAVRPTYLNYSPKEEVIETLPVISTTEEESTENFTIEEVETEEITEENTSSAGDALVNDTTEEITTNSSTPQYIIKASHYAVAAQDIYFTNPVRQYTEEEKTLLAKMLYCEAGGENWDCQVATLSAIINHVEHYGTFSVLDKGNHFSPASYYRYKTPTSTNWEVLDYVLSGHLIANVKYFQLYSYHNFGIPMFCISGVYFSK